MDMEAQDSRRTQGTGGALDKEKVGAFLAQLRKEKGYTQKELAEKLYVSDKAVSKWERALSMPDIALLTPLARCLGVSVTELLQGERIPQDSALAPAEVERLVGGALELSEENRRPGLRHAPAYFASALAACLVLNSYIPMLSGTGGNSGTQASVAVIRALSLDEVDFSDIFQVLWKELRVSLLCGVCLAGANFVKMQLVDRLLLGNAAVTPTVCLVVCLTILFVVVFAKCVGCSLPILAEKIGLDPAVMASPFISTIVDATSLLIYFRFASWFLL